MVTKLRSLAAASLLAATCLASGAQAQNLSAINAGNQIVTVNASAPGTVVSTRSITGLGAGQSIVAFDARPASGGRIFYGVSNTGQLYAINPGTGAASAVGAPLTGIQGTAIGLDFNPTVDRIRIISSTGQNLRVNPDTGAAITDGPLNILVGGQRIGQTGNTAAAYTNNFPGATSTTLYVINTQTGLLQIQNPPNDGTLVAVGGLGGAAAGTVNGFDISIGGDSRATVNQNGVTNLYTVNLQTGAATLVGQFGTGTLQGLAFLRNTFATEAGLTPNQQVTAGVFDNFTSVGPNLAPLLASLDLLPNQAARAEAFNQLGPTSFGILPDAILQTTEFVDGTMRTYLRDVRQGGTPRGAVGSDTERRLGGFLVATGRKGDFQARGDRAETDYYAVGGIAGVDMRLSPTMVVGVAGGYDAAELELTRISPDSRIKTWFFGGYGTFGFGPAYLDVVGSYGNSELDLRRNVAFGNFARNSRSDLDARYYSLSATTGFSTNFAGFEVEPYVGGRYADVKVDPFSEGTGLTDLNVGRQDVESLQSILGLRIGANIPSKGAVVRPSVRAEYRHEFENSDVRLLDASFSGAGINTPFRTTTSPLGEDYLVFGAGLTVAGDSPIGLAFDYTGQMRGGYDIHSLQMGLRVRF